MEGHDIPPRAVLLAPPLAPLTGSNREGLHSVFRRTCEKNQLTVSDVLSALVLPFMNTAPERLTRMATAVHLIDRGCGLSNKIGLRLQGLIGLSDLSSSTLVDLVRLNGVDVLAISRYRKWCSVCFSEDIEGDIGPYDRLLWSIDAVQVCPVHRAPLRQICQSCGAGPFMQLTGRDISGRCPKCLQWLGGRASVIDEARDEHSRFLLWVAQSFSDLLDTTQLIGPDVGTNIISVLKALAEFHFNGIAKQLAEAIERNKSVVSYWLHGRAAPRWQALCEISYTFQIPLIDMLTGQIDGVALSPSRRLPLAAAQRLSHPRKSPVRRDVGEVRAFLLRVEHGELPSILTIVKVAERLDIHVRELARIAPKEVARLSPLLVFRRQAIRERAQADRVRAICEQIPGLVSDMLRNSVHPTRRAVETSLAKGGISVRRGESEMIRTLVREAISEHR
jgi:hypothetical protein